MTFWGYSSVGRAPALQAGGHEFESRYLHLIIVSAADAADWNVWIEFIWMKTFQNIRERKTCFELSAQM